MRHIKHLKADEERLISGKTLLSRATGRFYTPEFLGEQLARALIESIQTFPRREVRIIDPFCGDGRLLVSFLRQVEDSHLGRKNHFFVSMWDSDTDATRVAQTKVRMAARKSKLSVQIDAREHDTFLTSASAYGTYDICITNPPWEALKPDHRELKHMGAFLWDLGGLAGSL